MYTPRSPRLDLLARAPSDSPAALVDWGDHPSVDHSTLARVVLYPIDPTPSYNAYGHAVSTRSCHRLDPSARARRRRSRLRDGRRTYFPSPLLRLPRRSTAARPASPRFPERGDVTWAQRAESRPARPCGQQPLPAGGRIGRRHPNADGRPTRRIGNRSHPGLDRAGCHVA